MTHAPSKRCFDCNTVKPYYEFTAKLNKTKDGLSPYCAACGVLRANKNSETYRGRSLALISACRRRAKERGSNFALDDYGDEIENMMRAGCALTGIAFDMTRGEGNKPTAASIDRIRPSDGYVPGNVRLICRAMNSFIGEWGEDAVAHIAEAFVSRRQK